MKKQTLKGTGVALVTPFKKGKKIDYKALERLIDHVITGGVDFLVALGTTGESVTLTPKERRQVLDAIIKINKGRLPIVAGLFGGNNTNALVEAIRQFNFKGIDYIMSSSPAYNKPSQEGIFRHYMAIEKVAPRPIIIYNVPGRTASNIEARTALRLAYASDKFVAIKEASKDMEQASHILKQKPEHFEVLSGDDPTALALIALGGKGVISVLGNALPREFSTMVRAALEGNLARAQQLHLHILDLHHWLYEDGNPAGIKYALELQKICRSDVRLPLVPAGRKVRKRLKEELDKVQEESKLIFA